MEWLLEWTKTGNIWLVGLFSEALHFGCACALGWVVSRPISTTLATSLYRPYRGAIYINSILLMFSFGWVLHRVLDLLQPYF